jgi:hypothetical protein
MKLLVIALTVFAILFAPATWARADRWCGEGPYAASMRPCEEYQRRAEDVAARIRDDWAGVEAVKSVTSGLSNCGDYFEVTMTVNPDKISPSMAARLPRIADGIPVRIETGIVGWIDETSPPQSASQEDRDAYTRIVAEYGDEWDRIPGVLQFGTYGCSTDTGCSIGITVQLRLLQSVRDSIPDSIDGQRIILIPLQSGC